MQLKHKRNAYISIAKLLMYSFNMDDSIFSEVMDLKSAHEVWIYLNEKYGAVSNDDDDEPKEEAHEDVEYDHNLVIVEDCSTSWSSDGDNDDATTRSLDKLDMMPQVMQLMILLHAHLMVMMVHARAMIVMLLQAHPLHHIASCHKVILRYLMLMWLIMLINMMSLLVDLLA
jgi:hypothetical protein